MAAFPAENQAISLDDLMKIEGRAEVYDGELVEMTASGALQQFIINNIVDLIAPYVRVKDFGRILGDGFTYLMFSPLPRLKDSFEPDVSFLSKENVPADWDINRPHPGAPDFAVEVISPDDRADRIQYKTRTYLEKGTRQVWEIYPSTKAIHTFTNEGVRVYTGHQAIDISDIIPGLEPVSLKSIFELPEWLTKQAPSQTE